MLYFKHYSNMRNDVKLRRVVSRYGLEGYGLYCLIVESITESLTEESPIPDLQETCEDIACFYGGDSAKIKEMAHFMINQGLLDIDELTGAMLCHKIYKFLDTSSTRSDKLKRMIRAYKTTTALDIPELSQTVSDNPVQSEIVRDLSRTVTVRREEKRREEKRKEEKKKEEGEKEKIFSPSFEKTQKEKDFKIWWDNYPNKENRKVALAAYLGLDNLPPLEEHLKIVNSWKKTEKWTDGNGAYILQAATWLNNERWTDELPLSPKAVDPGKISATAPAADHRTEWEDVGEDALEDLLEAVGK